MAEWLCGAMPQTMNGSFVALKESIPHPLHHLTRIPQGQLAPECLQATAERFSRNSGIEPHQGPRLAARAA